MSRNGTLLAIPVGSLLEARIKALVQEWEDFGLSLFGFRARWLSAVELELARAYPQASTADRALTARTLAPFALAQPGQR